MNKEEKIEFIIIMMNKYSIFEGPQLLGDLDDFLDYSDEELRELEEGLKLNHEKKKKVA